ncbi:MAG: class I SAM-dependent methyltransferase [Candidatus Gracilibacteria bacterium]|nr:class I SAM-dependent methyltransferase [Candidatus Gracilibacteria bacterium]
MNKIERSCPICSSTSKTLVFTDYNRREGYTELIADYVTCDDCSMQYLTNIPDFQSFAETYEDIYVNPDIEKLKARLAPSPKKNGKKVLDIGCNHGTQLIPFYNKGYEIYGIDLNKKAIEDCKKYLPSDHFFHSTVEGLDFEDDSFDVITTSHVLEHVYDLDTFLSSVYRLLKRGGTFTIKVPHGRSLEMLVWGKYSSQSWVPFHINMFDQKSITHILKKHGFESIKTSTNPYPWWWILSYRQWAGTINAQRGVTNFHQNIFHKALQVLIFPILFIIAKMGYGEELEVTCNK